MKSQAAVLHGVGQDWQIETIELDPPRAGEVVLHTDLIPLALMLTRKGGTCVVTAMTPLSQMTVPLILSDLVNSCKTLKGALYGEMNARASMPMLLSMYEAGVLKLDELVTRRYRLEDINDAIAHLREGSNIRGVIDFS